MPSVGIDSGSVAVKGVIMSGEELLSITSEPSETEVAGQCRRMIEELKDFLSPGEVPDICVTGYGREMATDRYETISEIFANALGAGWAWRNWANMPAVGRRFQGRPVPAERPDRFRTVIDVGGQDSKVITFDGNGVPEGFAMNDRCAAGTGRFLQELAAVLELESVQELDALVREETTPAKISSACTVFAESEVVSMVAGGIPKAEIAGGVFRAVAERAVELADGLQWQTPVFFDGGTAHMQSLRRALEYHMGVTVAVSACPQHITAIGAAIHAASISTEDRCRSA